MSDDKFSLDELMNEYSGKSSEHEDLDLDSILGLSPAVEQKPFRPEMHERRMELIKKEIISGDYEHKYLGEDYRDIIDEENRRKQDKARKIAEISKVMEQKADMEATAIFNNAMTEKPPDEGSLAMRFRKEAENRQPAEGNTVSFAAADVKTAAEEFEKTAVMPALEERPEPKPVIAETAHKHKVQVKPHNDTKRKDRKKKLTDEDQDEFQRKYEELTRKGLGVKSRSERENSAASEAFDEIVTEMEKRTGPGRTFSEKAESDDLYEDREEPRRRKRTPVAVTDRSGLVSYKNNSRLDSEIGNADDPLDNITGNSVDKILSEREKSMTFNAATMKIGEKNNTLSNFLDKLMKPDETSEDRKNNRSNTELMENMKKAKRERLSKTSNIPPVERNSFTDLKLDLDDKIINDSDEETAEQEMLNTVKERSTARKKDFKFIGDEEDSPEDDSEGSYIDDFENIDDAEAIAADIEQSKASMVVRLMILLICFLLSLYITVSNELKVSVIEFVSMTDEPSAYLFVNTILGMVAAFAAYNAVAVGLSRLFTFQANCDSFAALTSVTTILLSMAGLLDTGLVRDGILHEYVPVGIAALIFNTLGKLLLLDRTQRNFRYISGDYEHYAMFSVKNEELAENFTKGSLTDFPSLAAMRKTEMVSDFMKNSYSTDMADRFCRMFAPIILAASLVIGVIGAAAAKADYNGRAVYIGITSFVSCLCLCSCFSSMFTVNLPMRKASVRFNGMQGAVIGFDAIEEFSETNSVLADACRLFPKGTVTLANIKIFSDTRIDEAIVEAASLACRSESIMNNMFYDIIGGKTSMLEPVESYIYEDSMGLCGWINNKRVLLGNRKLMENHSIDGIPSAAKEKQYTGGGRTVPVYLSISGELSAMFLINLIAAPGVASAMRELDRNHIKVILRSVDSAVTVERMSKMFDVSPGMLKILPFRTHSDYEKVTSYAPKQSAALVCSGKFGAFASLIISTKRIRTTVMAGIAVQAISILLGILLAALLVLFKSYSDLSAGTLLLYNLIFTAIYYLISLFRKV